MNEGERTCLFFLIQGREQYPPIRNFLMSTLLLCLFHSETLSALRKVKEKDNILKAGEQWSSKSNLLENSLKRSPLFPNYLHYWDNCFSFMECVRFNSLCAAAATIFNNYYDDFKIATSSYFTWDLLSLYQIAKAWPDQITAKYPKMMTKIVVNKNYLIKRKSNFHGLLIKVSVLSLDR